MRAKYRTHTITKQFKDEVWYIFRFYVVSDALHVQQSKNPEVFQKTLVPTSA